MRYIIIILSIFVAYNAHSQVTDTQLRVRADQNPDSILVMSNDTNNLSPYYKTGKWRKLSDLGLSGGSTPTNLSIAQSGGTQVIQSSTGTDVGVRNLYGLLITEGATDTLHFRVDSSLIATQYDITQIPISSLKAAIATNTKDHANYAQEWKWNTLAGVSGLKLSSTSTAAASNAQKLLDISLSGVNGTSSQSTYGAYISNTHTGTGHINYGLYSTISGGNASSSALYGNVANSTGNGVTGAAVSGYGISGSSTGNSGIYGLSSTASSGRHGVHAEKNTSNTNNMDYPLGIYSYSTGTPAAGFGGGIQFWNEPATGSTALLSNTIETAWTTATTASAVSKMTFKGMDAATLQDLMVLAGSGRTTLPKYGAGTFTAGTPTYNIVVDASGNLMEAAVPVGGTNIIEENNATVQSANVSIDFQNPFDVATDGGTEVNVSLDCGEFTKVTALQSDDFLLLHDSISQTNERILWSDVIIDLISFKDGNISAGTGNAIDVGEGLDIAMSPSTEANINLDASEFLLEGTNETDESFLVYDPDTTAGHRIQRIPWSDVVGTGDGNGIYSGDGTTPADVDVTITDNIDFGAGNLYIDETTDRVGIGTNSPTADFHIKGASGSFRAEPAAAGSAGSFIVGGTTDSGLESALILNYTDADYGGGLEQTGASWSIYKDADVTQATSMRIVMPDNTDATIMLGEKSAALSDVTTESHIAFNGGVAFTQNYEWTATGTDLTLDRSFNIVNVSGSGALGDEINLPEVNSTSDNWDSALTAAQVQVGQEYTISNFRSTTNLVIRVFTGDEINGAGVTTVTLVPTASVIVKCNRFSAGVGYWKIY